MSDFLKRGETVFRGTKPSSRQNRTAQEDSFFKAIDNARDGRCQVYWGCHGCDYRRGMPHGEHRCWCGAQTVNTSVVWGDDVTDDERWNNIWAGKQQAIIEGDRDARIRRKLNGSD